MAVVRHRFQSLETLGVAVEYFPRYYNPRCGLHPVDVVLFTVALRGQAKHYIDNDMFDLEPGTIGVTSYGQRHDVVTTRRGIEKFNVYLDLRSQMPPELPPELPPPLRGIFQTIVQRRPDAPAKRAFQFRASDYVQVKQTLQRIESELRDRREGYEDVVRGCLTNFLIDCCRAASRSGLVAPNVSGNVFPHWVSELRKNLDSHFTKTWTLAELSRAYGVSAGHLNRTFLAYTGRSVVDYLVDRRIAEVKKYLESGDWKISRIAKELNYSDSAYLHRQFKQRTAQTPAQYRRKQRQK